MFLLEAVSEAMSLNGVGSATGVDAGATLGFGVVDLSGLKPNLACNKRVARVTVSAVIASCVEDTTEVWSGLAGASGGTEGVSKTLCAAPYTQSSRC